MQALKNARRRERRREQRSHVNYLESVELISENASFQRQQNLTLSTLNDAPTNALIVAGTSSAASNYCALVADAPEARAHGSVDRFVDAIDFQEIACETLEPSAIVDANAISDIDELPPILETESDGDELEDDTFDNLLTESEKCANILQKLAIKHSPTQSFMSDLLVSLKKEFFPELPKDARTLMKTPTKCNITAMGDGKFFYTGIKFHLDRIFASHNYCDIDAIKLSFNVDGIPLYKSKNVSFTPILCSVKEFAHPPFVVALHCGSSKPPLEQYLDDFISELKLLLDHYDFDGKTIKISICSFICDAPAKCYIRCSVPYNAYFGCDKCTQKGKWKGRIIYPRTKAPLRTDHSYRNKFHIEHHNKMYLDCPLFQIIGLDMVTSFPLDYLHLVLLGVMRKLLNLWKKGATYFRASFSKAHIDVIDTKLKLISSYWPSDFNRKPRTLNDLDRWKGTELRQFLLYIGSIVLKDALSKEEYRHYLLFFTAITILIRKDLQGNLDIARELLLKFVRLVPKIYNEEALVYNVHSLVHLTDDVERKGPLDAFSAFPFESLLGQLKRLLKKSNHPIEQAYKRLYEGYQFSTLNQNERDKNIKILQGSTVEPIGYGICGTQCTSVIYKGMKLACNTKDQFIFNSNKRIMRIERFIVENEQKMHIVGRLFERFEPLLKYPVQSDKFQIVSVRSLEPSSRNCSIICASKIFSKAVVVPVSDEKFAFFPLHPEK
jgi:hypothetical protein